MTDIIHLNVGGRRFSTSRQTLTYIPDSFFSSLLSGRISSHRDETGAIFIDRDPFFFGKILNYLRTKEIQLNDVDIHSLRHEAEFYGIKPLVRRLMLCEELEQPSCGGILFHGSVAVPVPPFPNSDKRQSMTSIEEELINIPNPIFSDPRSNLSRARHTINSSLSPTDLRNGAAVNLSELRSGRGGGSYVSHPLRVTIIKGHFNWLAVAFPHFVSLYRLKDTLGWNLTWTSSYIDLTVDNIALNAKVMNPGQEGCSRMLAVNYESIVQLWQISDNGQRTKEVGRFSLTVDVSSLFFIGSHLVALSRTGKFGVWHAMTQNWQVQDVVPITSYDTTGSLLLLGCENGSIYNIDMQKFPLRMKDNDLLVTELYKDPAGDRITALSVYLTPKANQQFIGCSGNWIEIAYGTSGGTVRVIVQHPETTFGQGPQLFQTFTVHCCHVNKVMISEKHLVAVCAEYNHVRSWSVTRFRGMISTQPGSMPLASFKIVSVDDPTSPASYATGNDFGPFGEKDDQQVFVQKVVPETDQLFVRLSSTGKRVCVIRSVDQSIITAFCIHECEGSSRMGSRPRRYLFTGHCNGTIQIWDLSTALELSNKAVTGTEPTLGGPTPDELMHLVDQCDLSNSRSTTPSISPSPYVMAIGGSSQCTPQALRRRFLAETPSRQVMTPGGGVSAASSSARLDTGDSSNLMEEADLATFQNE